MHCSASGLSSPFVHLVANIGYPVLSRAAGSILTTNAGGFAMLLVYLPVLIFEACLEMPNEPAFVSLSPEKL
jgi:hypothetical protein